MVVVINLENKMVSCLTEKTHTDQGASDLKKMQEVRALTAVAHPELDLVLQN